MSKHLRRAAAKSGVNPAANVAREEPMGQRVAGERGGQ
jgi:hypothetical protein